MLNEVKMNSVPDWKHHRVIHSRFPPKNLFDNKNAAKNLLLADLESMTSDRLQRWREFVAPDDFRSGNGWGAVMASFCYVSQGRFNTSTFGAYYCADSPHTAIAEWGHHSAKLWRDLRLTDEASAVIRCYTGTFREPLLDISNDVKAHNPDSYKYSQALAQLHKVEGVNGLVYRSVRNEGGICAALFRPPATSPVKQGAHYSVQWSGNEFVAFAKISQYEKL
jgi:hypothetical protein